jgi:hypothetical protein
MFFCRMPNPDQFSSVIREVVSRGIQKSLKFYKYLPIRSRDESSHLQQNVVAPPALYPQHW